MDAGSFGFIDGTRVNSKEITDADFDFDRNSTGTRVNEDYLIETVATQHTKNRLHKRRAEYLA